MRPVIFIGLLLVAVTLVVYWQAGEYAFVNIDDVSYVVNNPHVAGGLTTEGIEWSFTAIDQSNWHPITWLSHMADVELFGMNPRGHHLTNIFIHTATSLCLFLLLFHLSGFFWQSAFVAALFALHPLHVESVAWVAERKDVLSGFFLILTLWLYAAYVESGRRSLYFFALFTFAVGLMAKPMLVTLPVILLLVDFWPLRRYQVVEVHGACNRWFQRLSAFKPLLVEKIPFFILALASSVVTIYAQSRGGSVQSIDGLPLGARVANAATAYLKYIAKTFWPADLAVFYPFPASIPLWQVACSLLILLGISVAVVRVASRYPYLVTGWFWYLVTLLPVIGLVQVGMQSMADRYSYIPSIGLFIAVVWALPAAIHRIAFRQQLLVLLGGIVLTASIVATWQHLPVWKNSETLFRQALRVTSGNFVAHYNLGLALVERGAMQEAREEFQKVVAIKPDHLLAYNNLGYIHAELRDYDRAIPYYIKVLELNPNYAPAYNNLGVAFDGKGSIDEAIRMYRKSLELDPVYRDAHNNLGVALMKKGAVQGAIEEYEKALAIDPDYDAARHNLKKALERKRLYDRMR